MKKSRAFLLSVFVTVSVLSEQSRAESVVCTPVPCQHFVECKHRIHVADLLHPHHEDAFGGGNIPCRHFVECTHPAHIADTLHSFDCAEDADVQK